MISPWTRIHGFLAAFLLIGLTLVGCSTPAPTVTPVRGISTATPALTPTPKPAVLTIFAASSLSEAFRDVQTAFEAQHPGLKVSYNFGGSPTLRTQLEQGAQADIYASADKTNMDAPVQARLTGAQPVLFTQNVLTIIVSKENTSISTPVDLAKPGLKLVLALPAVPAGNYARQSLKKMDGAPGFPSDFSTKVLANLVSEETNVRQVVAKVALGEADAGIVYPTDVTADVAGKVRIIPIPDSYNVIATYYVTRLKGSGEAALADQFIAFLISPEGQAILAKRGFGKL